MATPEPAGLSFDKAKFDESPSSMSCAYCGKDLYGTYYEVNSRSACEECRFSLERARDEGSPIGRGVRAVLGGAAGGVVGAGIYYAVLALTGYEIGLVAIVVGLLVGFGVRWGSGGIGGRRYQVLAAAITYMAIVSTYVPFFVEEARKQSEAAETAGTAEPPIELTAATVALALLAVIAFVLASPFLAGIQNVIGILIIGFALYEAWRVNAYAPFQVEGPFQIGVKPKETSA
ncbi:MAG TPA: hypothetical protein VJ921_13485 [Vicinamibacteria bacterium]|nr:hypothetical protein [Vicinamibacteria bacterium]